MEDETPPTRAEQIAGRALSRAEEVPAGRLRSLAARLQAAPAVAERIAARAVAAGSQRGRRYVLRRIGAIAAAAATLSVGAIGVGAIANQAAPGDLLYGVDRAYEAAGHAFGSRAPHTEERLTEALALIDRGRSADAVALIDEAVKDYSVQNGLTDLEKTYAAARGTAAAVTTTTTAPAPPETSAVTPSSPAAPPTTIVAAAEPDPAATLRLAVEMLLSHVQTHETDGGLAETVALAGTAVAAVEAQPTVVAAPVTTETTPAEEVAAPSTESTTTTVAPNTITLPPPTDVTATTSDETTLTIPTTTIPSESTTTTTTGESSTTTTTGASTTTTTQADDGSGGIILPPQP